MFEARIALSSVFGNGKSRVASTPSRWRGRRPQPGDQRQDFREHL
jgi:hypothetical protein